MKVIVDLQACQSASRHRGIGRYSLGFSMGLIQAAKKLNIELIFMLNGGYDAILTTEIVNNLAQYIPRENIKVWQGVDIDFHSLGSNLEKQKFYNHIRLQYIYMLGAEAIIYTSLFEGYNEQAITEVEATNFIKSYAVFYDVIPLMDASNYLQDDDYRQWYLNRIESLKRCDGLLSISNFSKHEAIEHLNWQENDIVNISSAIDTKDFFPYKGAQTLINGRKYILYSGAADSRKNHFRLIRAFSLLPTTVKNDFCLVLAGGLDPARKKDFEDFAQSCGLLNEQLYITGHISDSYLRELYTGCYLYIFPSLYEGFGLPVLEAMHCGAPVVGSNLTSLPEIIVLPEAQFDPHNENEIKNILLKSIEDKSFYKKLCLNSQQQKDRFSWLITGERALSFIKTHHANTKEPNNKPSNNALSDIQSYNKQCEIFAKELSFLYQDIIFAPKNAIDIIDIANAISQNVANAANTSRRPTIYFDISDLYHSRSHTGIQRVTRKILHYSVELKKEKYDIVPIYFDEIEGKFKFTADKEFDSYILQNNCLQDHQTVIPVNGDIYILNDLILELSPKRERQIANLRVQGIKLYFQVYDILPIIMPQYFIPEFMGLFSTQLQFLAKYSDGLICISETVARQVFHWYQTLGKNIDKKINIGFSHIGTDLIAIEPHSESKLEESERRFLEEVKGKINFLMVGTIEPRKGHLEIITAFEDFLNDISSKNANLIIVGKDGWNNYATKQILKSSRFFDKNIFWLDKVSDGFLEQIYHNSTCLVAASYGEGFGLPIIEAFQRNLLVLAREIEVFQEVGKESAIYFNDKNLKEKLFYIYNNIITNTPLPLASPKFLTWRESTENFWHIIQQDKWLFSFVPNTCRLCYTFMDRHYMGVGPAGYLTSKGISTNGQENYLIFGPYLSTIPSQYHCHIYFTDLMTEGAYIDVCINKGENILFKKYLSEFKIGQERGMKKIQFDFELLDKAEDLEVRLYVTKETNLTVYEVNIFWNDF